MSQESIISAFLRDRCGEKKDPFTVEEMEPIPAGENPFHHDLYNMGQSMGTNLMVMFGNHSKDPCGYLILINTETGRRIKIHI